MVCPCPDEKLLRKPHIHRNELWQTVAASRTSPFSHSSTSPPSHSSTSPPSHSNRARQKGACVRVCVCVCVYVCVCVCVCQRTVWGLQGTEWSRLDDRGVQKGTECLNRAPFASGAQGRTRTLEQWCAACIKEMVRQRLHQAVMRAHLCLDAVRLCKTETSLPCMYVCM